MRILTAILMFAAALSAQSPINKHPSDECGHNPVNVMKLVIAEDRFSVEQNCLLVVTPAAPFAPTHAIWRDTYQIRDGKLVRTLTEIGTFVQSYIKWEKK